MTTALTGSYGPLASIRDAQLDSWNPRYAGLLEGGNENSPGARLFAEQC